MSGHTIAIDTYGAQRVTDPATGKLVSAHKLGYTTAVTAVLLALYGENARDVLPRQATYRYLHIEGDVLVRHGHILLTLTPDELATVEAITRQHHRAAVFLWRDERWWAFPDSTHSAYTEPGYGVGPKLAPTGLRPPSPSTDERVSVGGGITLEKSEREDGGRVWWWINGDTYPHRELLRRHGARWSKKRQAWYWVGAELPAAIHTLTTNGMRPNSPSPLLTIFGGSITDKERTSNGDLIVRGANGVFATRTTWIDRNDRPYTVWEFDLPPHERVGNPRPVAQAALKQARAQYSISTGKWHFEQADIVTALDRLADDVPFSGRTSYVPAMSPELAAMIEAALEDDTCSSRIVEASAFVEPDTEPVADTHADEATTPAIRVIKPIPMPADGHPLDAVQTALREVRVQPLTTPVPSIASGRIARIPSVSFAIGQSFVGELTGSITGQVFCYGYAVHDGVCVYLNMAGPRMAVEAIRAKLSKGDQVSCVPLDAPLVELTAGEGNSGMYHPYLHYLPEARFASLILVHDWAVTPNYGGKATTFIFRTSDAQATAKLRHHVIQLVNIPVFEVWSAYLYEAGQRAMLVRKCRSPGGIDLLSVDLDVDAWTRLITGGLEGGIIRLP
jgi:hypothetical protein